MSAWRGRRHRADERRSFAADLPKPVHGLPVLVSAGSSPAGVAYAAQHSDIIFATASTGADPEQACVSLPAQIAAIKAQARQYGREVKVLVNPHVICRPSEREAHAWRQRILTAAEPGRVRALLADAFAAFAWKEAA
ncbi:MAG: LLM class flavin-dependent oxidoreductase [Bacteroidales bacterium]|nr:LLM class flavin-dependent oxidoreductase [Bacteroidales bacterium]